MKKRKIYRALSIILFIVGLFLLVDSLSSITSAAIGVSEINSSFTSIIGLSFILISVILFSAEVSSKLEKEIKVTSSIKSNKGLERAAEDATKDEKVQEDIDKLIRELAKGNLHPGLGRPGHIEDTKIYYSRGRNGGRLYYHKIEEGYEIIAKSSKANQRYVIDKIKELYQA